MSLDDMEITEHKEGTNEVVKIFIIDFIRNSGMPGACARAQPSSSNSSLLLSQQVKQFPPLPDDSLEELLLLPENDFL